MQDLFGFLSSCRTRFTSSFSFRPRQEFRSHRRQLVDDLMCTYLNGFDAAEEMELDKLNEQLNAIPYPIGSVCGEGAYCALAIKDLTESNGFERIQKLIMDVPYAAVTINEGIGHALAQLQMSPNCHPSAFEQFFGLFAMDGYGFHETYFRWTRVIHNQYVPQGLTALGMRGYDQGVGRGLWLVGGADPDTVADLVSFFPLERRADIWSGIGLMTAFWGPADEKDMRAFARKSGKWRVNLQEGVAMAAYARLEAKSVPDHAQSACELICGATIRETHEFVLRALSGVGEPPANARAFLNWKHGIAAILASA